MKKSFLFTLVLFTSLPSFALDCRAPGIKADPHVEAYLLQKSAAALQKLLIERKIEVRGTISHRYVADEAKGTYLTLSFTTQKGSQLEALIDFSGDRGFILSPSVDNEGNYLNACDISMLTPGWATQLVLTNASNQVFVGSTNVYFYEKQINF